LKNGKINLDKIKYISESDFTKINERSAVHLGDVLFAMIGTIGNPVVIKYLPNFAIKNVALFKPKERCDSQFLKYYLESPYVIEKMGNEAKGTTQKFVGLGYLRNFPVDIPTIPEQKRIVAILDQAFADIEQARAKTEQNLRNARELFESYLYQTFSQRSEGWRESKLKTITSKIGSGATPKGGKASYKEEGISLIRSMNVHDRRFKLKDLAYIDDAQAEKLSNVVVEENDVLLNITGASVARCCVATADYLPARVNQHVSIIRVDGSVLDPELLNYMLTSKFYKEQLLGIGEAGSTRQAITKTQIENFVISFPEDLFFQKKLIEELKELESKTVKVQEIYSHKLQSLDELKKSILQKAFSGELSKTSESKTNKEAAA
jgi:type I restriction enzyme S subunit